MTLSRLIVAAVCLFTLAPFGAAHAVYNADLGRWMTRDPAGYIEGPNVTAYVDGAPLRAVDPSGLLAVQVHTQFLRVAQACPNPATTAAFLFQIDQAQTHSGWLIQKITKTTSSKKCSDKSVLESADPPHIFYEAFYIPANKRFAIAPPSHCSPSLGQYAAQASGIWYWYVDNSTHTAPTTTTSFSTGSGHEAKGELRYFSAVDVASDHPASWPTGTDLGLPSGCLPSKIEANPPQFWNDSAAAQATRKHGMTWDCCCPNPWTKGTASPGGAAVSWPGTPEWFNPNPPGQHW